MTELLDPKSQASSRSRSFLRFKLLYRRTLYHVKDNVTVGARSYVTTPTLLQNRVTAQPDEQHEGPKCLT